MKNCFEQYTFELYSSSVIIALYAVESKKEIAKSYNMKDFILKFFLYSDAIRGIDDLQNVHLIYQKLCVN